MSKKFIYLLIPVLFAACTVDLDVPLPEHTERIVVNAFLSAGQVPEVYLTRSYGPLEDTDKLDLNLYEADAELFVDGQSIGKLVMVDTMVENWDFQGNLVEKRLAKYQLPNHLVEAGKKYELTVSSTGYEDVRSEMQISSPVTFSDFTLEQNVKRRSDIDGFSQYQSLIKLKIDDPAEETNYYLLDVELAYDDPNFPGNRRRERMWNIEGPVVGTDQSGAYTTNEEWITDQDLDGQTIESTLLTYLENSFQEPNDIQELQIDTLFVTLFNANEASYQYLRKLQQQRGAQDFDIPFFPTESIVVYNNIENGYGIFGSLTRTEMVIVP